jgi:hypothetical protein
MNWRQAYFCQARSDYDVFRTLNDQRQPLCHKLHYLQMASEKLAKGFLCDPNGANPHRRTHYAFVNFLKVSKGRPDLRNRLGYGHNYKAYSAYIDSLLPLAERIEKLAPVGGDFDTMNPEYPWIDARGDVICPANYNFPDFGKTELAQIQKLLSGLFRTIGLP